MNSTRRGRTAIFLFGLVAISSLPGRAQAVFCTNCSTELTQLANNIQLIDQLARQVQLVQQAVQQTENLTLNTTGLDQQSWSTTLARLRQLNTLLGQAKSLSYTSADLDGQFAAKYGDYKAYAAKQAGDETLAAKLQQWSEDTNSSVLSTLKAAGIANQQIHGEDDAYLRQLESLAETAQGRMQAIQVSNQIAMAGVRQTQKLQQLLLLQVQLLANHIQRQGDRETAEAAQWQRFSKFKKLPTNNGRSY